MTKFRKSVDACLSELLDSAVNVCSMTEAACKQNGKPCKIKFTLDESMEFNAYAQILVPDRDSSHIFGGLYEVTLNIGVLYKLAYYFEMATSIHQKLEKDSSREPLQVMIHTDQSEIGSKQLAAANFYDFDLDRDLFSLNDINSFFESVESNFWPFWFHKRELSTAASICLSRAMQFLVLHECAHISRGHLEYLDTQIRMPAVPTTDLAPENKISEDMIKAMEIDADQQAIFTLLHEASKLEISDKTLLAFEGDLFIIALLFAAFDLRVRTASTYVGASHPDPDLRYHLTTTYTKIALSGWTGRAYTEALEVVSASIIHNVVKIQRELGILGGGYSVYLAASIDDDARRVFTESSTNYFKNAMKLQEQWIHRIGDDDEAVAKQLLPQT